MNKFKYLNFFLSLCLLVLSGCNIPKTRTEYSMNPNVEKLSFNIPRSLDAVYGSLNKQLIACEMSRQIQRGSLGRVVVIDTITMTIKKVSPSKAEFEYRFSTSNAIGEPEGGNYMAVADFEAIGTRATKASIYSYGSRFSDLTNALRKWAEGDDKSCHGYGPAKK